jgi:hypothetical protein
MGRLIVLDGRCLVVSDESGDLDAREGEGYFLDDVRHLSRWRLTVDGEQPKRRRLPTRTRSPTSPSPSTGSRCGGGTT